MPVVLVGMGCGAETLETHNLQEDEASIINGNTNTDPSTFGAVFIADSQCTGILLTNQWILTARHCAAGSLPQNISLNSQRRTAAEVIPHYLYDVSLVRVLVPFLLNGSSSGFSQPIWRTGSVTNKLVTCVGYGSLVQNGAAGTFSTAELKVTSSSSSQVTVTRNSSGQIVARGDSGGTCFHVQPDGRRALLGVSVTANNSSAQLVGYGAISDFIAEVMTSKQVVSKYSGRVLSVADGSTAERAQIRQLTDTFANYKRWRFVDVGLGCIKLQNLFSGKCASVPVGQRGDHAILEQRSCVPGDTTQAFRAERIGEHISLRSDYSGRCIDVPANQQNVDAALQQYLCHGGATQQFTIRTALEDAPVSAKSAYAQRCIDVPGFSFVGGQDLQIFECNGGSNQSFRMRRQPATGAHTAAALYNNQCWDITGGSHADHAKLQQYPCNDTFAQLFFLDYQPGAYYRIVNANSHKCLDVPLGHRENGTKVQQFGCHDQSNQLWRLTY